MKTIKIGRHGECWIRPVSQFPKGKRVQHDRVVVGHSETGHHHVLQSDQKITVLEPSNMSEDIFFELVSNGKVVHQKSVNRHEDLTFAPGKYQVTHKLEYDPFQKVRRAVWD